MKIIIGEGSCGIAAGAAKIHDYLGEHAQFAELSITGCIGMCYLEPIVDVIEDGIKRTYCKVSTELLPEFTAALERRDFEGAFLKGLELKAEDRAFLENQTRIALRNCGKINPTANKKCAKCKFPLEKSVILNEANTDDDFVMLTIDFPNLSEMKDLLGSAKLFNKFKLNLDKVIADYVKSIGLRRQIIDKTYVIRFYKDYTFNGSVNSAVNAAIEILNLITRLNCKLTKRKNTSVRCNMFLLKKSVNGDPNDYKSGFNINMIYQKAKDEQRVLNSFQIITDTPLFEALEKNYKLSPLNSVMIDGQMQMFYELDVKDLIVIDPSLFEDEEDENEVKVPRCRI